MPRGTLKYDLRRYRSQPMDAPPPDRMRRREESFLRDFIEGIGDIFDGFDAIGALVGILPFLLVTGVFIVFGLSLSDFLDQPSLRKLPVPFAMGMLIVWGASMARSHHLFMLFHSR